VIFAWLTKGTSVFATRQRIRDLNKWSDDVKARIALNKAMRPKSAAYVPPPCGEEEGFQQFGADEAPEVLHIVESEALADGVHLQKHYHIGWDYSAGPSSPRHNYVLIVPTNVECPHDVRGMACRIMKDSKGWVFELSWLPATGRGYEPQRYRCEDLATAAGDFAFQLWRRPGCRITAEDRVNA